VADYPYVHGRTRSFPYLQVWLSKCSKEAYFKQENGDMLSDRLRTRLTRHEAVLVLIDRRRKETGNSNLGWALEKKVLEIEMADLEAAIVAQESTEHAL